MSYADSLRQQARWIKEALDPNTPKTQRIDLGDIDTDELEAAANELERLQRIIDSRPAINAGLPESYIKWSQEIYLTDFLQAAGTHS